MPCRVLADDSALRLDDRCTDMKNVPLTAGETAAAQGSPDVFAVQTACVLKPVVKGGVAIAEQDDQRPDAHGGAKWELEQT